MLHILKLFPYAEKQIPRRNPERTDWIQVFGFAIEFVMPLYEGNIAMIANRAAPFAIFCKRFGEQIAIHLATCLEPDGVIVVLTDIGNLDVAYDFAVIHHGQATGPAVVEHSCLGDASWATHERSCRVAVFVNFFVAGITEGIAVFGHEL